MRAIIAATAGLLLSVASGWCSTYTVTNTSDAGAGSLRQAILDANAHGGTDTITFPAGLSGRRIKPATPLPALSGATVVDGDLDNDHAPDIILDGSLLGVGQDGLQVQGSGSTIQGLAIIKCQGQGLVLFDVTDCVVRDCHLGVSLAGDAKAQNVGADLYISDGQRHTIGGPGRGNSFSGGHAPACPSLSISGAQDCVIQDNYFGLNRAGTAKLGTDGIGIQLGRGCFASYDNALCDNVFGGITKGIVLSDTEGNTVQGNLFGLAIDGRTRIPLTQYGVDIRDGASHNLIGGTTAEARNVFAGSSTSGGIQILHAGTVWNSVQGNYFGMNAAGTARKPLLYGIVLADGAGRQTIGGANARAGNWFASSSLGSYGIYFPNGGSKTLIRNNVFGEFPDGSRASRTGWHIMVGYATQICVRDNTLSRGTVALQVGSGSSASATNNRFTHNFHAVSIQAGGNVVLGNLGNASTDDDGGNVLAASNGWAVYNASANRIPAEGNRWGTTAKNEIEARIYDKQDSPGSGRVDFDPLFGGVSPTGATVAVTGASALPTAAGAEIAFTLSSPAEITVTVLNVAGRPVATVLQDRPGRAGLQRVVWSGQTMGGTRAPGGTYLVRIAARSADGAETSAIARLMLSR